MGRRILALMMKDLRVLASERTVLGAMVLMLALIGVFVSTLTISSLLFSFYVIVSFPILVFSVEEKHRAEKYAVSLPVRRAEIVWARYAGSLVLAAVYFAFAFIANGAFILFKRPAARLPPFSYCALLIASVAAATALLLPLYFRLGFSKARAAMFLVCFLPFAGWGALSAMGASLGLSPTSIASLSVTIVQFSFSLQTLLLIVGGGLVLWALSIPVSVFLYSRRDL